MVMVDTADFCEEQFAFVCFAVFVCICQDENVWGIGNNDLVSENADAECGIDARILIENRLFISVPSSFCIFQHYNAIPLRLKDSPFLKSRAVIDAFGDPNPA